MHAHQHQHALLAALLACALAASSSTAGAQPAGQQGYAYGDVSGQQVHVSTTMIVLLAAVVGVFLFIAISTIYLRHCTGYDPATEGGGVGGRPSRRQRRPRGLDPAVVESFPTMKYAEARELRDGGKDAVLECAVCLSEFDDDEELRLLPKCSHAFHPDCIGEWLAGHVTCPVCRCNLAPDAAAAEANVVSGEVDGEQQQQQQQQEEVVVAIDVDREGEEEDEERRREAMELERIGSQRRAVRSRSGRPLPLPRSHSTGHSLATTRLGDAGDLERFTLRLPEHVRREMVAAAGEESLRRTAVREGRVGGGARSARIGRSDRWPSFIARTFSSRVIIPAAAAADPNSTSSEIVVIRQEDGAHPAAVVIDVVTEEDDEERRKEELELQAIGTQLRAMRSRSGLRPKTSAAKLPRSHSTGHSLAVRLDGDLERYTLRLPEHVHREMVAAGEQSVRRGRRLGEGVGMGARCSPRFSRSGRWSSFLSNSLSGKLSFLSPSSRRTPDSTQVEVSSSSSSSVTKVKGKRVAAVDVADDGSAHGTAQYPGCTVASSAAAAAVDVEKAATRQVRT
uniref:RING-type E3 ubiquitin transferase n=1 Tax=Oryza barthii TaxID=65489 RepID=A0A0D3FAR3_9ORYZ